MRITSRYTDGRLLIQPHGELDHHSARQAMEEIIEAVDSTLPRELLLDMSKLSFMDSSGIAVIIKTNRRITEAGGKMLIVSPQPQPKKVIEAAGIDRLIEIHSKWEVTT